MKSYLFLGEVLRVERIAKLRRTREWKVTIFEGVSEEEKVITVREGVGKYPAFRAGDTILFEAFWDGLIDYRLVGGFKAVKIVQRAKGFRAAGVVFADDLLSAIFQ